MKNERAGGIIWSIVSAVILLGLALAVLNNFDWDLGAAIEWAWNGFLTMVSYSAGFFGKLLFGA